jgi:hypothetical protein
MSKPRKDRIPEERIRNEAVVDAYEPDEQVMGWYDYLETKLRFPFRPRASRPWWCHHSAREKPSKSGAWRPKRPVRATCSCSSAGRAGTWQFLSLSTGRGGCGPVDRRSHRRLALLDNPRQLFLNRAHLAHFTQTYRKLTFIALVELARLAGLAFAGDAGDARGFTGKALDAGGPAHML